MLNKRSLLFAAALCAGVAFLGFALHSASRTDDRSRITIGSAVFRVLIADSASKQIRGLSGVEQLGADEGMLFVFSDRAPRQFWMKEMRFPLDVLWIADSTVVDISTDIPAPTGADIPRMGTELAVDRVLEIPAGTAERLGISIGDRVR